MNTSKVLEKWRNGEVACGTTLHLKDPSVFEMAAALGIDAIWLDLEHYAVSVAQAAELIRATRAGGRTDVIVRPGKGEFGRMARLLEAGAHGIMYPFCESPAEAREVVRWAKFPPIGQRGFDGSGPDSDYMARPVADYTQRANQNTFVIIQIEDAKTLEIAEEIAKVEGVDALMLGPADMSVRIGQPGIFDHPLLLEAQQRIATAATTAGKCWVSTSNSIEHAKELAEKGAKLIFSGGDILFVRHGLLQLRGQFEQIQTLSSQGR